MRCLPVAVAVTVAACASGPKPAATPVPDTPPPIRYAAGTTTYRTTEQRHIQQTYQGQPLTTRITTTILLTIGLSPHEDGLAATFAIDSAAVSGGPAFPPSAVDDTRGARFTALLLPGGRLVDLQRGDTANPFTQQVALKLGDFLPRIPPDGVSAGARWVDTTESSGPSGGVEVTVRSVNARSAGSWTAVAGVQALEILTESQIEITGSGVQSGQAFSLSGSGSAHGRQYLAADGRYLGGTSADSITMRIDVSGTGIVIPVTQRTVDTVRVVQ